MNRSMPIVALCRAVSGASADFRPPLYLGSDSDLSRQQRDLVEERMQLLNSSSYLPSRLPINMNNRDSLELTGAQIKALHDWRRDNYQKMVDAMNTIIEKRI